MAKKVSALATHYFKLCLSCFEISLFYDPLLCGSPVGRLLLSLKTLVKKFLERQARSTCGKPTNLLKKKCFTSLFIKSMEIGIAAT